jgi:hypothetical protein
MPGTVGADKLIQGRLSLAIYAANCGGNHMAKKRNAQKTKIKRRRIAKKNKSKRMPRHLDLVTYVPAIAT